MKFIFRLLLLCSFLMVSFASEIIGQTIQKIDGTSVEADSLDLKIQMLMTEAKIPGLTITVFNENKPIYSRAFGYAHFEKQIPLQKSSVMYAASFAKIVFTCIVLQLVEEQLLDLDKPLVQYLDQPLTEYVFENKRKGFGDLANDNRYKKITARMCLTHTTGFPNWRWFEPDNKLRIRFEPGSRYGYSGEGLNLLQFIIEKITNKDLETLSRERILYH